MSRVLLVVLLGAGCSTSGSFAPDGGGSDLARGANACLAPGQLCGGGAASCCNPADCVYGACCVTLTLPCASAHDCCSGACVDHACCSADRDSCQVDSDCCGGSCNGEICCKQPGSSCQADSECCGGSCDQGKCGCLPSGALCGPQGSGCCSGACERYIGCY